MNYFALGNSPPVGAPPSVICFRPRRAIPILHISLHRSTRRGRTGTTPLAVSPRSRGGGPLSGETTPYHTMYISHLCSTISTIVLVGHLATTIVLFVGANKPPTYFSRSNVWVRLYGAPQATGGGFFGKKSVLLPSSYVYHDWRHPSIYCIQ